MQPNIDLSGQMLYQSPLKKVSIAVKGVKAFPSFTIPLIFVCDMSFIAELPRDVLLIVLVYNAIQLSSSREDTVV